MEHSTPSRLLRWATFLLVVSALFVTLFAGIALAGDPTGATTGTGADVVEQPTLDQNTFETVVDELGHQKIAINFVWVLVAGALVLFMQVGFAMVETGFTRAKNASHVVMTNFVIFAIGLVGFWAVGFGLMFGGLSGVTALGGTAPLDGLFSIGDWGLFGTKGFFLGGDVYDVGVFALFFFQLVFMDTAATIPTGAMAGRWKFSSFVVSGSLSRCSSIPSTATGCGAEVGWPGSARTSVWDTESWTSPDRACFTRWAALALGWSLFSERIGACSPLPAST